MKFISGIFFVRGFGFYKSGKRYNWVFKISVEMMLIFV